MSEDLAVIARETANLIEENHKGAWGGVMLQHEWLKGLILSALSRAVAGKDEEIERLKRDKAEAEAKSVIDEQQCDHMTEMAGDLAVKLSAAERAVASARQETLEKVYTELLDYPYLDSRYTKALCDEVRRAFADEQV